VILNKGTAVELLHRTALARVGDSWHSFVQSPNHASALQVEATRADRDIGAQSLPGKSFVVSKYSGIIAPGPLISVRLTLNTYSKVVRLLWRVTRSVHPRLTSQTLLLP
jgi:hypothetical protein